MITLEENALETTNVFPQGNRPGTARDAGDPTDSALLATLNSRIHCRTPMKRVDREELPMHELIWPDGRRTAIRPGRSSAPAEVATYRCMCGFTMDAPSVAMDYAAAS